MFKKVCWTVFPILLLLLIILGKFFLLEYFNVNLKNESKNVRLGLKLNLNDEKFIMEIMEESILKLKERWELGDLEGNFHKIKFECPDEIYYSPSIDEQYLRCNPNYLQCYFSGKSGSIDPSIKIIKNDQIYTVSLSKLQNMRFYEVVSRNKNSGMQIPPYGILVKLVIKEFPQYSLTIVLENSCNDTYLPQRIYAYGSKKLIPKGTSDWTWDNFNQDIFVDKFLVSNRDIIEWISSINLKLSHYPAPATISPSQWAQAATQLTINEMQAFCAFRGKQLLMAHVLDAATFYPADLDNPRPTNVARGPYPWERKLNPKPFYKEYTQSAEQCRLIYSEDCLKKFPHEAFSSNDASWIEMNQILGGILEALTNPLYPNKNLKASSYYFPSSSDWHQLGLRASWDGEGFNRDNFQWVHIKEEIPQNEENFKVGFRCMTFAEGEK